MAERFPYHLYNRCEFASIDVSELDVVRGAALNLLRLASKGEPFGDIEVEAGRGEQEVVGYNFSLPKAGRYHSFHIAMQKQPGQIVNVGQRWSYPGQQGIIIETQVANLHSSVVYARGVRGSYRDYYDGDGTESAHYVGVLGLPDWQSIINGLIDSHQSPPTQKKWWQR